MTLIYAQACVFVFGMFVGAGIGLIAGRHARVNEARNNTPEAIAHVHSLLDDVPSDLDEIHGDIPRIPFRGSVR